MRIESVYLHDVGPFDDVTIDFPEGKDPNLADVYLLTGPNGCGKSTVLYTLASLIAAPESATLGTDQLSSRMKSRQAIAAFRGQDVTRCLAWQFPEEKSKQGPSWLAEAGSRIPIPLGRGSRPLWEGSDTLPYSDRAAAYSREEPMIFDWAAFAYSSLRSTQYTRVEAIKELTSNPFDQSLGFESSSNAQELVEWVANQQFRRLKAKESGLLTRAAQFHQSIEQIERAITEITGEDFFFITSVDDNDVRIRFGGDVLQMHVLPAGLQSILSWIGNLLMRLDRIQWDGNIPATQRSFLLLLDEIDVHLHPVWQRKVIPVVQRIFPKAQIIASTHSPFVVSSAEDAHIITFSVKDGKSELLDTLESQKGSSYRAVLREIFGIKSDFDIQTEEMFQRFRAARDKLLSGETEDRTETDRLAGELASRSEEVAQLVGFELRQLARQLAQRTSGG